MSIHTNFFPDGSTVNSASDFIAPWLAAFSDGVFAATDFAVTADSPADLAVTVAAGRAMKSGHFVNSDAAVSVAIGANTSGYNRYDLIVLEVDDANTVTAVKAVQGVPSSSPVAPVASSIQLPLALVLVGNNVSVINTNVITDMRSYTATSARAQAAAPKSDIDNRMYCSLLKSTSQTVPYGIDATIAWDIVDGDPYGLHNTANPERITASRAGRWLITGAVRGSSAVQMSTQLYKNGAIVPQAMNECGKTTSWPVSRFTAELALSAGDYIELHVNCPNESTSLITNSCMFQARYMGPA